MPAVARRCGLSTTVIGSYPKPSCCASIVPDWFLSQDVVKAANSDLGIVTDEMNRKKAALGADEREQALLQATEEVLSEHERFGIDVPTDGEVRRENYIHHLCRSIEGVSFEDLTTTKCRPRTDAQTGETVYAYEARLPTVVAPVRWRGSGSKAPPLDECGVCDDYPPNVVAAEWKLAQERTSRPLKYTLPGPMTIIGTLANVHYVEENGLTERRLGEDLARLVKDCVDALVEVGCKEIQIDEPLFARKPDVAIEWGIANLDTTLADVPDEVFTTCHICCGYPNYLDHHDYEKASNDAYLRIVPPLARTRLSALSLEDAHRPNDFAALLPLLGDKVLVLGCIKIASSEIETVEQIESRLREALTFLPPGQIIVAPDCGLGHLTLPLIEQKMTNMVKAARKVAETALPPPREESIEVATTPKTAEAVATTPKTAEAV
jgi:5-methyltetrahydropteroyltriglutamate--homocysteine methyltransferase